MEDNFRNVLIILSAIIIAAIFAHGFWTIRKNKNPYKLKAKAEKVEPMDRGFDGSGFDQDGVSRARVVSASSLNQNEIPQEAAPAPNYDEDPLPQDLEKRSHDKPTLEPTLGDLSDITDTPPNNTVPPAQMHSEVDSVEEISLSTDSMKNDEISTQTLLDEHIQEQTPKPVYQAPVSQPKQTPAINKGAQKRSVRKTAQAPVKRNQMEINFGDELDFDDEPMPSISAGDDANTQMEKKANIEVAPEVIVVSVVMNEDNCISGAALLPALLTLGLRYGDMDIFHRHEDNAGNGKVTFSLANMMNPGTFNLDEIESFSTQGISLFMTLPNAGDPFEVFEQMMSAAKQLSMEFNGQLLDDKRSVMTKQTEQHYTSKIREFERKNRIAHA
ncbi:cell division protein ZipA [Thalassotalea profundi]|uniref:Cell division protein ZipA n=1 Tax=Thalassotalea profundi TaxID=2036687 RepID=A0ABQ3J249_9GAMM|nr:cell division protein ZipA [Thalassotalea profundi]GHE98756.1 cell division protein ZipA [Thalassotalea profundi]